MVLADTLKNGTGKTESQEFIEEWRPHIIESISAILDTCGGNGLVIYFNSDCDPGSWPDEAPFSIIKKVLDLFLQQDCAYKFTSEGDIEVSKSNSLTTVVFYKNTGVSKMVDLIKEVNAELEVCGYKVIGSSVPSLPISLPIDIKAYIVSYLANQLINGIKTTVSAASENEETIQSLLDSVNSSESSGEEEDTSEEDSESDDSDEDTEDDENTDENSDTTDNDSTSEDEEENI